MFSENNSNTNKDTENFFKQEIDNQEATFRQIRQQNQKTSNSTSRMQNLFINSLELVEQDVADGNTKTALAYLETYHLCLAINSQANRFLPALSVEGEELGINILNREFDFEL